MVRVYLIKESDSTITYYDTETNGYYEFDILSGNYKLIYFKKGYEKFDFSTGGFALLTDGAEMETVLLRSIPYRQMLDTLSGTLHSDTTYYLESSNNGTVIISNISKEENVTIRIRENTSVRIESGIEQTFENGIYTEITSYISEPLLGSIPIIEVDLAPNSNFKQTIIGNTDSVVFENNIPVIEECIFKNQNIILFSNLQTELLFKNNIVEYCASGIEFSNHNNVYAQFKYNFFKNCGKAVYSGTLPRLDFYSNKVIDCSKGLISKCEAQGYYFVANNLFVNADNPCYITRGSDFLNNTVSNTSYGVCNARIIKNNIFHDVRIGAVNLYITGDSSNVEIQNNLFSKVTNEVRTIDSNRTNLELKIPIWQERTSINENGYPCDIYGNISGDPSFIDEITFEPDTGSIAIDAGLSLCCVLEDHFFTKRPLDGNADSIPYHDIGYIEKNYGPDLTISYLITPPSSENSNDGVIIILFSGGQAPYFSYWIHSGETTDTLRGLSPGEYVVNAYDIAGNGELITIKLEASNQHSLSGHVYGGLNTPISNARVIATKKSTIGDVNYSTTTNANGEFEFLAIPEGNYVLHASPATNEYQSGYFINAQTEEDAIVLELDTKIVDVDFHLLPEWATAVEKSKLLRYENINVFTLQGQIISTCINCTLDEVLFSAPEHSLVIAKDGNFIRKILK